MMMVLESTFTVIKGAESQPGQLTVAFRFPEAGVLGYVQVRMSLGQGQRRVFSREMETFDRDEILREAHEILDALMRIRPWELG